MLKTDKKVFLVDLHSFSARLIYAHIFVNLIHFNFFLKLNDCVDIRKQSNFITKKKKKKEKSKK